MNKHKKLLKNNRMLLKEREYQFEVGWIQANPNIIEGKNIFLTVRRFHDKTAAMYANKIKQVILFSMIKTESYFYCSPLPPHLKLVFLISITNFHWLISQLLHYTI